MTEREAIRAWLVQLMQGWYAPRPAENAWQWGEKRIVLRGEESQDFAGPYDSSMTCYTRFLMEFATGDFGEDVEFLPGYENQEWNEFALMKSSQTGFTLAVLVVIAYYVAVIRKNVLYAIDSREEARRISKSRLQPMLQDCADTRARLSDDEDDVSNLTLFLMGLVIYLIGSHSEGAYANKSCSLVVVDEVDVHPLPAPGVPETVDLARDRLKASGGGKLIVLSKPKTESDVIAREERTGTRHRCVLPCPHCDHYQELVWERVRFDHCKDLAGEYDAQRVEKETYYECELCHRAIDLDREKPRMLARRRWRQTNARPKPGKISAQISDLYSPFASARLGRLANEWIEAQKSVTKLIAFVTGRLGRPWRFQTSERTVSDIMQLRGGYERGTCPIVPFFSALAADTQDDVRKWVKGCFSRNGDLYVVDWGATLAWDELTEVLEDPIPIGTDGTNKVNAMVGIIDEGGHLGTEVRRFALRSEGKWWPCKGRGGIQVRKTVFESAAVIDAVQIPVYHYDDDDFKKQLYLGRIAKSQRIRDGREKGPTIYLPDDLEGEFIDELVSEKLVKEKDRYGFTRERWKKDPSVPNDWGDAIKQLLVIWYVMEPYLAAAESSSGDQ